jgi:hypothetical protein
MQKIEAVFSPLIGQLAWSVRKGHGSFLTMEFGDPHRYVREPVIASPSSSPKVKRNLAKRRVAIVGQWHLWIQYSEWEIATQNYSAKSRDVESSTIVACFDELDGQILLSAASGITPNSTVLKFDLGGELHIRPWSEAAMDDAQWSLYSRDGNVVAYNTDGSLVIETSGSGWPGQARP